MGIGMRPQYHDHDLKPGQCISNEVGCGGIAVDQC